MPTAAVPELAGPERRGPSADSEPESGRNTAGRAPSARGGILEWVAAGAQAKLSKAAGRRVGAVCPVCGAQLEVGPGESADGRVGAHLDAGCLVEAAAAAAEGAWDDTDRWGGDADRPQAGAEELDARDRAWANAEAGETFGGDDDVSEEGLCRGKASGRREQLGMRGEMGYRVTRRTGAEGVPEECIVIDDDEGEYCDGGGDGGSSGRSPVMDGADGPVGRAGCVVSDSDAGEQPAAAREVGSGRQEVRWWIEEEEEEEEDLVVTQQARATANCREPSKEEEDNEVDEDVVWCGAESAGDAWGGTDCSGGGGGVGGAWDNCADEWSEGEGDVEADVGTGAEANGRLLEAGRPAAETGTGGTMIVYAPTRDGVEEIAARLAGMGHRAAAYHAGLPDERRGDVQRRFVAGDVTVLVATVAFGMGINKAREREREGERGREMGIHKARAAAVSDQRVIYRRPGIDLLIYRRLYLSRRIARGALQYQQSTRRVQQLGRDTALRLYHDKGTFLEDLFACSD